MTRTTQEPGTPTFPETASSILTKLVSTGEITNRAGEATCDM
jgi:hypothetical protein